MSSVRAIGAAVAISLIASLCTSSAHADNDEARASYDRATAAYDRGDFVTATREYSKADELAPHPVALRWAIRSAVKLNDPVVGMNLVLRSEGRAQDGELRSAIQEATSAFAARVTLLKPACPALMACTVQIDGGMTQPRPHYIAPGRNQITFEVAGQQQQQTIDAVAGTELTVTADAPGSTGADGDGGALISPVFPIIGAVVTTGLLAGTVASGLDTLERNDEYLNSRTQDLFDSGMAAQDRTNVLIAVTSTAAVATLALGALAIDWSGGEEQAAVSPFRSVVAVPVIAPDFEGGGFAGLHIKASF